MATRALQEFAESTVGRQLMQAIRLATLAYGTREAPLYLGEFFENR